jgi:bifunctional non-homologous end joining protein LigD
MGCRCSTSYGGVTAPTMHSWNAFDLLELDGEDLRWIALIERKARLSRLLSRSKAGIMLNEHIVADGPTVFG